MSSSAEGMMALLSSGGYDGPGRWGAAIIDPEALVGLPSPWGREEER
ncbi:MAG: hypothetical protein HQL57_05725 [Magnetococcales bacterium]|nr:hypothetical protein [Magnetococcales bacterium]MBF0156665.1 hypothetical protein [Magnetococcales bacterium]